MLRGRQRHIIPYSKNTPRPINMVIRTKQHKIKQDAQLSQRDRAAGCVIVFAKSRRLELGDNI